MSETVCNYLKSNLEPIDWGDEEHLDLKYSMAFAHFLNDMASLVMALRYEDIKNNYLPGIRVRGGAVISNASAPHEPTARELIAYDDMFSIWLSVQMSQFVDWLLDQECPENMFELDANWLFDRWNQWAVKHDADET